MRRWVAAVRRENGGRKNEIKLKKKGLCQQFTEDVPSKEK
jgi:hypothetical protein